MQYDTQKRMLNAYELKSNYDDYFNKKILDLYVKEKAKIQFKD